MSNYDNPTNNIVAKYTSLTKEKAKKPNKRKMSGGYSVQEVPLCVQADRKVPFAQSEESQDSSHPDITFSLEDEAFECTNTVDESDSDTGQLYQSHLCKKLVIKDTDDLPTEIGEVTEMNPNVITSQSLLFDRLTSRGRKPQNISVDDLDPEQILATGKKKLVYRDLAMLPASAILPHVVIINMGAVAFFTDLDLRLDVANESNEKRLYRAMNNPTSPLYQNASFDWSLRNSQYDIPILSHPSAYFVCVVPSNKFTYGTKCGHSIIGKGKSYFRMIRKRCVELITINVDEYEASNSKSETVNKDSSVAQACSFVDLPPYFIEKTIDGDNGAGIAVQCENKQEFEEYLRCRLCRSSNSRTNYGTNNNDMPTFLIADAVEDAICRLALYYHASLDKRIPITIVSSKENIMTTSTQKSTDMPSLLDILKLLCTGRRLTNIPPRRKEWMDTLCEELQKNCSLKGDLVLEDMLCLWESPILRKDKKDSSHEAIEQTNSIGCDKSSKTETSAKDIQNSPKAEHSDYTLRHYSNSVVSSLSKEQNITITDEVYENPISKLFLM